MEIFEWLILKASVFTGKELRTMLEDPSDFIESRLYFSWERYFTDYLIRISADGYLAYSKKDLNPNYLNESVLEKILQAIPINL